MCEFCDAYVKGEDFEWIYKKTFGIIGDVQLDIDAYISSKKPAIEFVSSIFVNNIGPYEETVESVPITFCPFCGVDLEFEKEKYERQQREKFDGDEPSESSTTIFKQLAAAEAKIEKLEAEIKRLKEQDDIRRSWENYEERMGS